MSFGSRLLSGFLFVAIPFLLHGFINSALTGPNPPPSTGFVVKVLLASGTSESPTLFSVDGSYRIFEGGALRDFEDPGFRAYGYGLSTARVALHDDGRIAVNQTPISRERFCLVPKRNGAIRLGNTRYPGALLIERDGKKKIHLINLLDIEEYLAGVLFREMPASFPREALKSQVVAARTYAVYMMTMEEGFLLDDSRSQVYGGVSVETSLSRNIVGDTAGEIVTYEGKPIPAYYSSTCGGTTRKADDVFPDPSPTPLNNSVACGSCSDSPYSRWSVVLPIREVVEKFGLRGICSNPEVGVTKFDPAGRASEIALLDHQGNILKQYRANKFRSTINRGRSLRKKMLSTRIDRITHSGGSIRIDGGGFGHGVGLCQYGSRGLAKEGYDYRRILQYYYRECRIMKIISSKEIASAGS